MNVKTYKIVIQSVVLLYYMFMKFGLLYPERNKNDIKKSEFF